MQRQESVRHDKDNGRESTRHWLVVSVQDTSSERSGHVTAATIQQVGNASRLHHTSVVASWAGGFITGASLGSLPVAAYLNPDFNADINKADKVFVKSVSQHQYDRALRAQHELRRGIHNGQYLYAVFGAMNPVASLLTRGMWNFYAARKSVEKYSARFGGGVEDPFGIEVYDNDHHAKPLKGRAMNCVMATAYVLRKAGICIPTMVTPSSFSRLQQLGFTAVRKEALMSASAFNNLSAPRR